MSDIIYELEKSIFEKPIDDLTIDYLDIGLDMITDNQIIKNIPVVKTLFTFFKAGMSIKDRFFAKKLLIFANQIYAGNPSDIEIQKRKKAIKNHEKWIEKEIEEIVLFIDKFDFAYKAQMLAKLYVSFINGIISYDKYLNLLPIIDKWQKYDDTCLKTVYCEYKKNKSFEKDYIIAVDLASKQRLNALGIIGIRTEVNDLFEEIDKENIDEEDVSDLKRYYLCEKYKLTYEGIILSEILFEKEIKTKFNSKYFNISYF